MLPVNHTVFTQETIDLHNRDKFRQVPQPHGTLSGRQQQRADLIQGRPRGLALRESLRDAAGSPKSDSGSFSGASLDSSLRRFWQHN